MSVFNRVYDWADIQMSSGVRQTGRQTHRNKDRDKQTNTQKEHYNTQSKVQLKRPAVLNASARFCF